MKNKTIYVFSDSHIFFYNNNYYSPNSIYSYSFWERYLNVFDKVVIVSRVKEISCLKCSYNRVDGDKVDVYELPFMRGGVAYLKNIVKLIKLTKKIENKIEYAIFRVPSMISFFSLILLNKRNISYGLEVVADPKDCYINNIIISIFFSGLLKGVIKKAPGVSYVTKYYLQNYYPAKITKSNAHFTSYYSSIDLSKDFYYEVEREFMTNNTLKIIHIANSINSDIKGHGTLLKIVSKLKKNGYNIQCYCIGDGDKLNYYKGMAKELGIDDLIIFTGLLSSKADIRKYLIQSDIMIFPSRAEGLPRVIIEAMATGLPCLSSRINGIPELIESKYLFELDDVDGYVSTVEHLINNKDELEKMSNYNLIVSKQYSIELLQKRRDIFYNNLLTYKKKEFKYDKNK